MENKKADTTCKFNQDKSYHIITEGSTYSIKHTHPIKEIISRRGKLILREEVDIKPSIVELYYKTNIILLVVKNTLYFINDLSSEKIIEREFQGQFTEILNLKTRRDKYNSLNFRFYLLTSNGIFYGNFPQTKKEAINLTQLGISDKSMYFLKRLFRDYNWRIRYNSLCRNTWR